MGNDTKWADVAHYYAFSEIMGKLNWGPNSINLPLDNPQDAALIHDRLDHIRSGQIVFVPILRHRDDMTDAEVLECIKCGWPVVAGKPIKEFACIPDHSEFGSAFTYKIVFDGSPHYMAGTLSFRSLDSNQFIWLISRGFDMFGLIESGQAIRKEAGNGL